jgi:hypothetical protein
MQPKANANLQSFLMPHANPNPEFLTTHSKTPHLRFNPSLLLLINILSPLPRGTRLNLLIRNIPIIQIPHPSAQVSSEAQPAEIWCKSPCGNGINLAPDVGEVAGDAGQGDDVDGGFDGALGDEEERHPEEVEAELDGVEGCALFEEDVLFGGGEGLGVLVGCF